MQTAQFQSQIQGPTPSPSAPSPSARGVSLAPPATMPTTTSVTMPPTMRAVVASGYGAPSVLAIQEKRTPTPSRGQVCIRVVASTVTAADSMMRQGTPRYARLFLGVRRPKAETPGTGFAGVVASVGEGVTKFSVGDEVFGESGTDFGAHAEFLCVAESGVILHKPEHLSFAEAVSLCDGPLTSYNFLVRMAEVANGSRVLIVGASGALGSAAVQIAKARGATVTGVCSQRNIDYVRELGADYVIDYEREDFCEHSSQYDIIYDTVGASSFRHAKGALREHGQYLSPVLSMRLLGSMIWTRLASRKSAQFDATGLRKPEELREFLKAIIAMTETGTLSTCISKTYEFDQLHEAHALVDSGHKRGTLVLAVAKA